jgi:hypothetical protein
MSRVVTTGGRDLLNVLTAIVLAPEQERHVEFPRLDTRPKRDWEKRLRPKHNRKRRK